MGTHEADYDNHPHAFACETTFRETYTEAIDSNEKPADAIATAWKAHDKSVDWVYANVPLN